MQTVIVLAATILLWGVATALAVGPEPQTPATRPSNKASSARPLFGVIRWDAFNGGDSTTNPELKSLSPLKYHDRVPFFLKIESDTKVSGNENNQEIIDREIDYAKSAGIDYWAFVTGPNMDPNGMEYYALDKLLTSKHKADIQFCIILHKYDSAWEARVKALVKFFKEPSYVKVLANRPLLYVYKIQDMEARYGAETKKNLDSLVSATVAAGLGRPYIAFMSPDAPKVRLYGAEALSNYSTWSGLSTPYASIVRADTENWAGQSKSGVKMIPLASLGWNGLPRRDSAPPWGGGGPPYVDLPSPQEAAEHIKEAFDFVAGHRDVCDANCILVYAWNEFCEGGWLCPTYGEGTKRLDAVRKMVENTTKSPDSTH